MQDAPVTEGPAQRAAQTSSRRETITAVTENKLRTGRRLSVPQRSYSQPQALLVSKDTGVITEAHEHVLQRKHKIENEMAPSSPRRVTRAFSWSLAEMQRQYPAVPRDCSRPHKLHCLNIQCKRRRVPLLHAPVNEAPAQRAAQTTSRRETRKSKTAAADSNKLRTGRHPLHRASQCPSAVTHSCQLCWCQKTQLSSPRRTSMFCRRNEIQSEMAPSSLRAVTRAFSPTFAEVQRQRTAVPIDCTRPHNFVA